jgi:hypothetical protein
MSDSLEAHLREQIEHSGQFFWHRLRWRAVRGYLPDDSPFDLVDVGAGAGLLGSYLGRDRPHATYRFIEPIASLSEFLREEYGDAADASGQADYGSARFVTLLDVLEHQEDDRAFMSELVEKMESGSVLLLTVPALQKLWSQWDVALGHFRRYDITSLLACLDGLPITVDEVSFVFPELVPLGIVRSHRRAPTSEPGMTDEATFPNLPRLANDLLYGLGTASLAFRRHWKVGTSIFLVATVAR